MPYITEFERDNADKNPFYGRGNPGILAYRLSQLIQNWLPQEFRYADCAALVGVLDTTKEEFMRRVITPYEEAMIERNGDVWRKIMDNLDGKLSPVQPEPVESDRTPRSDLRRI